MNFLCDKAIRCPGSDFPVSNYSSEAPDREIFIGANYGWNNNQPPLGVYVKKGCVAWCISFESQEDADLCAARLQIQCASPDDGTGGDISDPDPGPSVPGQKLYYSFPQSCAVTCPDGSAAFGVANFGEVVDRSQELANARAKSIACRRAMLNRVCIRSLAGMECVNPDPFGPVVFYQLAAVTASPIVSWSLVDGALPTGWTLTPDGVISGYPDTPTASTFTVKAVNKNGGIGTRQMTINLFGITNTTLPDATVGTAYSEQLIAAGGDGAVTFALSPGSALPASFTLDADGTLHSASPTTGGDFTFNVTVTDANEQECIQTISLSVTSNCPDWNNDLVWPVWGSSVAGAGTTFGIPNGTANDQFAAWVQAPLGWPPDAANTWAQTAIITGYAGPACNCNLHLKITRAGTNQVGSVTVQRNFIPILTVDIALYSDGEHDFPFAVPDGSVTPYDIRIQVMLQAQNAAALGLTLNGVFSNV